MATSPIYNWPEPDNTDLVKNGALAIRTLGNAIDTTMATMVPKTIVDAKGDLIAGTAADTAARLAVGNNGETLVADSSTATGLRYQAPVQQNPVLNSAMQVWQRGTSIVPTTTSYSADRWQAYRGTTGSTVSRQLTSDTTNLPFIQYCLRNQRDSGTTATNVSYLAQNFENINSTPFVGKTVTLSFYARAGANYSTTASALLVRLASGTGTDENVLVPGFTGVSNVIAETATLTTTWQRFTYTGTVATSAKQLAIYFQNTWSGTAGAADFYEVTGVQLEVGSVATPFHTYAGTIQGELAACQRYYYRFASEGKTYASFNIGGYFESSIKYIGRHQHPVAMRTNPTTLDYANLSIIDTSGTFYAVSAAAIDTNTNTTLGTMINFTVSGATTSRFGSVLINNNTGAYLGIGAEL